ncbi:helix-turn-helix transcriptional regulator [Psychrobacillus lasiicapitis]|uniref:Response regulator transcription factor n=1 Tax=Psychrobacillus lasiicapitis TaxID=1636719 RepID=A0A544T361_9BACI|nr:response regulator transcription factor [Psychrobacillus lasiicapitis]TQR11892.1 response regulator transcription factor [Psychrobacillus lasiicapitis]GGA20279.1 hypothetical protein GCM10011384_07070 [Psychrobacillus lasiicapitis]
MQLTKRDYGKILKCLDSIAFDPGLSDPVRYRKNVLNALSNIFGYTESIFWLPNKQGDLIDPILNNVKDKVISEYLEFFQPLDVLIPNNLSLRTDNHVVKIGDIMSLSNFAETNFYKEFFLKHQYIDEIGMYIFNKNNIVGVIGLVRKEGENYFSEQDRNRLRLLIKPIESAFNAYEILSLSSPNRKKEEHLTARERELIQLVKQGFSNKEISEILFISINTVKKHLQNLYQKLNVTNRTELCYRIFKMN